jgi:cysteine desulfurase
MQKSLLKSGNATDDKCAELSYTEESSSVDRKMRGEPVNIISGLPRCARNDDNANDEVSKVYLDHNATTYTLVAAIDKMKELIGEPLNASSVHAHGRRARYLLESARSNIASVLGAGSRYSVVFVSSGTEANNLVVNNFMDDAVIYSAIEHPSVYDVAKTAKYAYDVGVSRDGIIKLDELEKAVYDASKLGVRILTTVMYANNETGVLQPIGDVVKIARKYGSVVHTDASQAVAKTPIDVSKLDVDFVTVSSHKIGGPHGIAATLVKNGIRMVPSMTGGGQERSIRAGTENVAAAVGFSAAITSAANDVDHMSKVKILRDKLEFELNIIAPDVIFFGNNVARLPNTSMFATDYLTSEEKVIKCDMYGISISAGSACSSGKVTRSRVLKAMSVDDNIAGMAVRVSLGHCTSDDDIKYFLKIWKNYVSR